MGAKNMRLSGGGVLIEPGNFALDAEYNKQTSGVLLAHMLNAGEYPLKRTGISPSILRYHTYGNLTSLRQYGRMGYEEMAEYPAGLPMTGLPSAEEYLWHFMYGTYAKTRAYFNEIAQRRGGWTDAEAEELQKLSDLLGDHYVERARLLDVPLNCVDMLKAAERL